MVKNGFIEACSPGPWGTPIVPVVKSNGEVRICGDFSVTLNPCLEVTGRTLPLIDDLSTITGNWFCILDMNQAYLQLKLAETSQEFCKLNTPFGSFKCKRMPFGISSAPGVYQEVISSILAGIDRIFIYLDDILLWGKTQEIMLTNTAPGPNKIGGMPCDVECAEKSVPCEFCYILRFSFGRTGVSSRSKTYG
jgi:hypothetical protein